MPEQSDAAIVIASSDTHETAERLRRVMIRERYRPQESQAPPGYPLAQDEQLSFTLGTAVGMTIVRVPVDSVFRVARWWSHLEPETPLAAVRRYAHCLPCLKFFAEGRPVWKLGDDPDYEVDYEVPTRRPVDAVDPAEVGLPTSARGAAELLESFEADLKREWLRDDSRLR